MVPDVLPLPTDDLDRAEHDLATHGLCAVLDVLDDRSLGDVRAAFDAAAEHDRRLGREQTGFVLDRDEKNQRVWNLLSRSPVFVDLVEHPAALRLLRSVLGWPMLLGNISGNVTAPGSTAGAFHADQLFVPMPWPEEPQGANAAWCIDDFTADNGATCFVPGSHRVNGHIDDEAKRRAVPYEAPAGTMVVFESRMWHRTGANVTADQHRRAAFAWYTRPIYRTQENWFLSLDPSVRQFASDELLELLGYRTSGLGLVNGVSPA